MVMRDQIVSANKIYGDPALDWVVLTTNNVINVREEWRNVSTGFK